jgi:nucleotide-binding universal stress UspA family protein
MKMARDQSATLFLLHVVDGMKVLQGFDGTLYVTQEYIEEFLAALRKEGKKILAKAESQVKKEAIKCQAVLTETVGHAVADVIIEQAKKCRADLIVVGTHGRRGITRLVMGSDAEGVVRSSRVPVLLVRLPTAARRPRTRARKI